MPKAAPSEPSAGKQPAQDNAVAKAPKLPVLSNARDICMFLFLKAAVKSDDA
jgi:hypothetical protein